MIVHGAKKFGEHIHGVVDVIFTRDQIDGLVESRSAFRAKRGTSQPGSDRKKKSNITSSVE